MSISVIEVNSICNCKCIFCGSNFSNKSSLPKEKVFDIIKNTESSEIEFSGGECLLDPNILLYIKETRNLNKKVTIITNGLALKSEEFCKEIFKNINFLKVSSHTININKYNKIMGTSISKETLYQIYDNIAKYSREFKVPILFNVVLLKSTYKDVYKFYKFLLKHNFYEYYLNISYPNFEGRLLSYEDEYIPFKKIKPILKKVLYKSIKDNVFLLGYKIPLCILYRNKFTIDYESMYYNLSKKKNIKNNNTREYFYIRENLNKKEIKGKTLEKKKKEMSSSICDNCLLYNKCQKVDKNYISKWGRYKEIKPFEKLKNKDLF